MLAFNTHMKIGPREISVKSPVFIIAEAGVNHNGDFNTALRLIDEAAACCADAVKFQAFKADELVLQNAPKADYQIVNTRSGGSQYQMLKQLEINIVQSQALKKHCEKRGILFLITPFDEASLFELDSLDLAAYKISSTDITNPPFLKMIAKRNKPVFLSTGMCFLEEVKTALEEIHPHNRDVVLMQCTSNYPAADEDANLRVLDTYKSFFDIIVGYSDHTDGIGAAPYAVAKGAKVIEKHFTLDKTQPGPDHKASLAPREFKQLVEEIRKVERCLGSSIKEPVASESAMRKVAQKYFVVRKGIKKGENLSEENLMAKRTGGSGISPLRYKEVFGKSAPKDYNAGEILEI